MQKRVGRLHRLSRRSTLLCVTVLLMVALLAFYAHPSLGGWKTVTVHNVMSSTDMPTISPATLLLLRERPASFWNCDLPETPCRYFDPRQFFAQVGGAGAAYASDYKRLGGTNKNLPAMTALSWSRSSPSSDKDTPNNNNNAIILARNTSFIHVHKCGGTTVKTILAQAKGRLTKRNTKNSTFRADINNYKYSVGGGSLAQKERNHQRRQAHIDGMIQLQQAEHNNHNIYHNYDSVVFTVVRDPIERFVSAVQQVMHYNDDFRNACLRWTARSTLKCAIQYAQDTAYIRDVHLVPMVSHFRLWDNNMANDNATHAVKIAVLHLKDIHVLAHYMAVATTAIGTKNNHTIGNNHTTTNSMPHGRDRSKVEYATSSVLAHMSVEKDCTTDMISKLCQLYAVDVAFMTSLGYNSRYCG